MSKSKGQSVDFTPAQEAMIESYMQEHQVSKSEAFRSLVTVGYGAGQRQGAQVKSQGNRAGRPH